MGNVIYVRQSGCDQNILLTLLWNILVRNGTDLLTVELLDVFFWKLLGFLLALAFFLGFFFLLLALLFSLFLFGLVFFLFLFLFGCKSFF